MDRSQPKARLPQFAALTAAALVVGTAGWSFAAPVPQPLVQYTFNEGTGTTAANTGSASNANLTLSGTSPASASFTASGTGVSGQAGDYAVDFKSNNSDIAQAGDVDDVDGLKSFTFQGWYNVTNINPGGNVLSDSSTTGGTGGINMYFTANDNATTGAPKGSLIVGLRGSLGNGSATSATNYPYSNPGTSGWVFFAVTYDGTTGDVTFYEGTTTTTVATYGGATGLNVGTLLGNSAPLLIGNNGAAFNFKGSLDDVRIFGSTTDGSGALSLDQLEAIRQSDVAGATAVPEPAAASAAGLLGLMMLGTRRRK